MKPIEVVPGMTITNGSSAMVARRHEHSARWKADGWTGDAIALEQFGGGVGMTAFVPDYLLSSWYPMPEEWSPVVGGGLEERYVPVDLAGTRYRRELRKAPEVAS
jgi:hypothetical protein